MDSLEKMDKHLEKFNLPRFIQKEIEIMTNQSQPLKLKLIKKNLPQKNKSSGPDDFNACLSNSFKKFQRKNTNSFYKATITLILKPDKEIKKKKKKKNHVNNNDEH